MYRGKINEYVVTRSSKIHTCAYMDSNSHIVIHTHTHSHTQSHTRTEACLPTGSSECDIWSETNKIGVIGAGGKDKTHTITSAHTCIRVCAHMDTWSKAFHMHQKYHFKQRLTNWW